MTDENYCESTDDVLSKIPHSNGCQTVSNRPLRDRRGRFGTGLQQLEGGSVERTALRRAEVACQTGCKKQCKDFVTFSDTVCAVPPSEKQQGGCTVLGHRPTHFHTVARSRAKPIGQQTGPEYTTQNQLFSSTRFRHQNVTSAALCRSVLSTELTKPVRGLPSSSKLGRPRIHVTSQSSRSPTGWQKLQCVLLMSSDVLSVTLAPPWRICGARLPVLGWGGVALHL